LAALSSNFLSCEDALVLVGEDTIDYSDNAVVLAMVGRSIEIMPTSLGFIIIF
jgi:hypothetical protein